MILDEPGYIFAHTGILTHNQINELIKNCIEEIKEIFNIEEECNFLVNVVTNKENKPFGHSYIWIQNLKIFYILIGHNIDGSLRKKEIPDPNWKEPDISEEEASKGITDWSTLSEIEQLYEQKYITIDEEPLYCIPGIEHTENQKLMSGEDVAFVILSKAKFRDKNEKNIIFSKNISKNFDLKYFEEFFKKFEKDKTVYISKNKKKFTYPIVNIKNDKLTIKFSHLYKNTAKFLISVVKKITLKNELLFFSQVK